MTIAHFPLKSLFVDHPPKGCKFVALFCDGSGAGIFARTESGSVVDAEGNKRTVDDLVDAGYGDWLRLPDDYVMWYERK